MRVVSPYNNQLYTSSLNPFKINIIYSYWLLSEDHGSKKLSKEVKGFKSGTVLHSNYAVFVCPKYAINVRIDYLINLFVCGPK